MEPRFLSVDQLAQRWGMSASAIYKWTASGKVPSVKLGSSVRIPVEYVERVEAEACQENQGDASSSDEEE